MMWTMERNTTWVWYSNLGLSFAGSFVMPCVLGNVSDTCPPVLVTQTVSTANFFTEFLISWRQNFNILATVFMYVQDLTWRFPCLWLLHEELRKFTQSVILRITKWNYVLKLTTWQEIIEPRSAECEDEWRVCWRACWRKRKLSVCVITCGRYSLHGSAKSTTTKAPRILLPRRCTSIPMLNVIPLLRCVYRYIPKLEWSEKKLCRLEAAMSLLTHVDYRRMKSDNEFRTAFCEGETQLDSNLGSLKLDLCVSLFLRRWFWFHGTNMIMRCWTKKFEYSPLFETYLRNE